MRGRIEVNQVSKTMIRRLFAVWLLSYGLVASADQTITLGSGISMPPYVIADKDRGIAIDVFRAVMDEVDIDVQIRYAGNAKVVSDFSNKYLDAVFIANRKMAPEAYFSRLPLVVFHNKGITLDKDDIRLAQIEDLSGYRIGAFRLASKLLPDPFAQTAASAEDYREYVLQDEQVQDLFRGERQVLVMDRTIFRYYLSQLRRQNRGSLIYRQPVTYHELFPKSQYFAAFHSEALRDRFDQGFDAIRVNGRYERILQVYESLLSDYLFQ